MNNEKIISLSTVQYGSMILGISLTHMQDILSIILILISIIVGFLNLILLLRKVFKDGKVTDEEIEEVKDELNKFKETIEPVIGENKDDKRD